MLHVLRETSLGRYIAFLFINGSDFSCSYIGLPIKFLLKNFISLKLCTFYFLEVREITNWNDMTTAVWGPHSLKKKKKKSNWLVACLPKTCENILAPPNTPGNGQGQKLTGSNEGSWLESCLFQNHEQETAAWADQTEFLACSNSVMLKNILIPYIL